MGAAVEAPVAQPHRAEVGRADRAAGAVRVAEIGPAHRGDLGLKAGACAVATPSTAASAATRIAAELCPPMLLAALLATVTAACPPNVANGLKAQPTGSQLITVEAASAHVRDASDLAPQRRLLDNAARPVPGAGRTERGLVEPARGRRDDADRRSGSTRRCTATSRTPASRSATGACAAGTGGTRTDVADVQHLPARRVREPPAVPHRHRGMWQNPKAYPYLAVVEFNMRPTVPGRGSGSSCTQTGRATNGCVSLAAPTCASS